MMMIGIVTTNIMMGPVMVIPMAPRDMAMVVLRVMVRDQVMTMVVALVMAQPRAMAMVKGLVMGGGRVMAMMERLLMVEPRAMIMVVLPVMERHPRRVTAGPRAMVVRLVTAQLPDMVRRRAGPKKQKSGA